MVEDGRQRGQEQERGEQHGEKIAEPVNAAEEIVEALPPGEAQPMGCEGNEFLPLAAQDLNPAERPAESLLFQTIEGQRHQPLAEGGGLEDADPAAAQHSKARLGILRNHLLVPAADLLQSGATNQAHRPGEDDAVAIRP